jgi:threonine aldolase
MMCGEAVVFFTPEHRESFKYIRKQGLQLGSKMRFISAQFEAYLSHNLWYENAAQANRMAHYLAEEAVKIRGITIPHPVMTNVLFPILSPPLAARIQMESFFYMWSENQARWMTSFDMTEKDIDEFIKLIKRKL